MHEHKLILGTAGHIDHGKTSLVRALTGIDTDRLTEEKQRGITIDLGFARLPLDDDLEFGIVDVPGHEAFIRNMLAGATGIDLALLVVAADEGMMPQTREHLAILELLGVRSAVVAITKADLVEPDWLDLVLEEVREELLGTPFAGAPLVPVSSTTGAGLDDLRAALAAAGTKIGERSAGDLFRLPVDRIFTVRGTGTVVTGTIWSGTVRRDQMVRILPADFTARVRSLQIHGMDAEAALAGQRAALSLVGIDRDRLERGDVLVSDPAWRTTLMLTTRLRILAGSTWALESRQRVRFHLGTAEIMARAVLLDAEEIGPGEEGWVQLRLEEPIVARAGDRFVIRSYSPVTTIGGGVVVEPAPVKRKRLTQTDRTALDSRLEGAADEKITALAASGAGKGVSASWLPIATGLTPAEITTALDRLTPDTIVRVGGLVFDARELRDATDRLLKAVEDYHDANPLRPGMDREELRRALPPTTSAELGEFILARLLADGSIEARDNLIVRSGFRPKLNDAQHQLREHLMKMLTEGGLTPPSLAELPAHVRAEPDLRPILKLLELDGAIVPLTAEMYLARPVAETAMARARQELQRRGALTPADFKEVFPISRKYLIPLLEFLDRSGVTVRRGDTRILGAG